MRLQDKVALVTGGSRGIGRAVSVRLAAAGAFVCVNYARNEEAARETLRLIGRAGGDGKTVRFDVADDGETAGAIVALIRERGRIDILVNNAGESRDGLLVRMKDRDWDRVMDTNLKGAFHCCRAVARAMMKQRGGRIINVSSVVALAGNAGQANYGASKAGLIGLTKSLARELAPRGICVNAVAPGLIDTDMTSALTEEQRQRVLGEIPLCRLGTPDDVAGVVLFLASDEAGYITGQVIGVNGGLYM
ncbi:MAG TPA: 3-oxoacyl-[acyl-carrier-protein] reductase [Syntrophales bacterium]|nr:3-oxoacyl-[acyl-carrier-protein] reductase [Syntrophobacterales bacterium]HQL89153.1 3-oxoacyl-[acyl-carrier-protein] reductase [Syntrophales bacterium]